MSTKKIIPHARQKRQINYLKKRLNLALSNSNSSRVKTLLNKLIKKLKSHAVICSSSFIKKGLSATALSVLIAFTAPAQIDQFYKDGVVNEFGLTNEIPGYNNRSFVDYDGDGDLDLLFYMDESYYNNSSTDKGIFFQENIGNADSIVFSQDVVFFPFTLQNEEVTIEALKTSFVDIDEDGDVDFVVSGKD